MSPETRALAQVLLDHHKQICLRAERAPNVDSVVVPYGVLCERAGLADFAHRAGPLLREIAEWCHENGWPPINSLAVNYATRMPGPGYGKAPGCSLEHWPEQVAACIGFLGYPAAV